MATTTSIDHDKAILEQVLQAVVRPAGVGRPRVEFKEDHSGDEAVYLTFPASKSVPLSKDRLQELTGFAHDVEERFMRKGSAGCTTSFSRRAGSVASGRPATASRASR